MHTLILAALAISIAQVQPQLPNRQPSLAAANGTTALVFGSGNTIWFSSSVDNGRHFAAATQVANVPVLPLGRHRGPRVAISNNSIVVSAIYDAPAETAHTGGMPGKGDLVAWRSQDGGHSWSKPVVINDVPGAAREGLHAMVAGQHGEVAAVWLDLRAKGTRLYGAYSGDSGATWSPNVLVYESLEGTICQCCDPSLVSAGANRFDVMFRNVVQGSRDMYLTRWNLGAEIEKPRKLGNDSWKLNACPMDGGGVASQAGTTFTAWRRDKTVYLDKPGEPEISLGEGKDVALTLTGKGPYVAWTGLSGIELYQPAQKKVTSLSAEGGFVSLLSLPKDRVLVAWERNGQIELQIVD